jgi:tetratricopeptide (TPR) repeat protein
MTEVTRDLAHARALLDLKRYDEAASLLAHIVTAEWAAADAWCLLAVAHLGASRYREAAAAVSRAIALAPSDDWPYRLASTAHIHLGDIAAALSAAGEACRLAPNEWRAFICLAQAQLATGVDFLAAERSAAIALRLAPDEPDAHFVAGQVSYAQEKWKAARAHQERALALDPAHSGALNELGRIRIHRGDHPGAARHFIQAAQAEPATGLYGRNVEVAIRRVTALTITAVYIVSIVLAELTMTNRVSRRIVVIGYLVTVALIAGGGAVQLWRMPQELGPLLRTRRVALALAAVYGAILVAVVIAVVTPADALQGALLAAIVLIFASATFAGAILRPKDRERRPR